MHCKNCDYPLWNIPARQCPECGTPFLPSQFEFVRKSVQFCCPHCGQGYVGTDERGHPDPREYDCVQCGEHLQIDDLVLRPVEGYSEAQTRPDVIPWLERKRLGRLRAFFRTIRLAMFAPRQLMKRTPPDAPVGEAFGFMALMLALTLTIGVGVPVLVMTAGEWRYVGLEEVPLIVLGALAIGAGVLGACLIWALLAHAVLRLTGATRHGLDRTLVAFSFTSGAGAITAVPVLGVYVGSLWWLISFAIAITAGQRVHGGRGAMAAISLPGLVLLVLLGCVGLAWLDDEMHRSSRVVSYSSPSAPAAPAAPMPPWYLSDVRSELRTWGADHAGIGPAHAIALLVLGDEDTELGDLAPFCATRSNTTLRDIPLGDINLAEFQRLDIADRLLVAGEVLKSAPEDVVAYRFGDFIFTYPGVNLSEYYSGLWIAVQLPDPDANGPAEADDRIWALQCCDEESFTVAELPEALSDQNALRAEYGLPPLPDLTTITGNQPVIADTGESSDTVPAGGEATPPAPNSE